MILQMFLAWPQLLHRQARFQPQVCPPASSFYRHSPLRAFQLRQIRSAPHLQSRRQSQVVANPLGLFRHLFGVDQVCQVTLAVAFLRRAQLFLVCQATGDARFDHLPIQ